MFITNMKPLAKYNCIKNYYRDILWEDKYLTEGVVRFLFKKKNNKGLYYCIQTRVLEAKKSHRIYYEEAQSRQSIG